MQGAVKAKAVGNFTHSTTNQTELGRSLNMRNGRPMVDKKEKKAGASVPLGLPPGLQSLCDMDTEKLAGPTPIPMPADRPHANDVKNAGPRSIPVIDGYRIDRKLGQGGMGSVFLATDRKLMRQVAIKIVSQTFQENTGLLSRFESEIQTLAALRHPHIAQLYSAGTCEGLPYFAMEFVDGETLESYARQPMKANQVAKIVSQLCDAVAYCHDNGVLHRDLKPSNVLLDSNQEPKIADFGLAKAVGGDTSSTRTGEILGTPGYMAPEQASGVVKSFTAACDIYALGAILYRLLTGRPPFVAAEPLQAIMQVLSEEPIPPKKLVSSIPLDLQTICLKCLEKKANKRYQSADELREDLQCFLANKPISARPAGLVEKSSKWMKRNPAKALLFASLGLVAVGMLFGLSWHNRLLSDELAKTKRLADHGGELSKWLINEHLISLNKIGGTTTPRLEVAAQVRKYLNNSYADIPPNAKYTRNLGVSYSRLASISGGNDQNNLGDQEQAVEYYLRSLELYDIAQRQDPNDETVKRLRTASLLALSDTYFESKNPTDSDRYFAMAQESFKCWESDDWETQALEIRIRGREALSLVAKNDFDPALKIWNELEEQLNKAVEIANPVEFQHQQIYLSSRRGECLSKLGRLEESETAFRKCVELAETAARQEPQNVLCQRRWTSGLERLGTSLFEQEKVTESLEQFVLARDILKSVWELDPDSVETALALASKHNNIGDVHFYLQAIPAGEKSLAAAIGIYQALLEKEQLGLSGKRQLAICMQSQANCKMVTGNLKAAADLYDEHELFCTKLITTDDQSIPELTQLAENHFQRSLMLLSGWMETDFDPESAKETQGYKDIVDQLDQCEECFARIAKTGELDANQTAYRNRIEAVRNLLEETIEQLKSANQGSATDVF
jgi:serine/threonine protein kinase